MSTTSKGNYYKDKTKKWYEKLGYMVQITEFMCGRQIPGGKIIYQKRDIFGSDGIAMNGKEIIFWNSTHSTTGRRAIELSEKKAEFLKYPFPPHVKLQIVFWEPRKKPQIYELDKEMAGGKKKIESDI